MCFVVLIFIQFFMAIDAKAKKYYNLSINKTKNKKKEDMSNTKPAKQDKAEKTSDNPELKEKTVKK